MSLVSVIVKSVLAALACSLVLIQSAQAETLEVGPAESVKPSGNAKPDRKISSAKLAPKPTISDAELEAALEATSESKPDAPKSPSAPAAKARRNFLGTSQTQGLRPPDTHGAVGANQFVEITNSKFEVFRKTDGALLKSVTLNSFCDYTPTTIFDPRVVYDKVWNRWVVVAEAFPESSTSQILCLAVSKGRNATGGFYLYKFQAPRGANTNFYDYPMVGMDQDAIIITANIFAGGYLNSNLFAPAKADLYNGRGFSVPVLDAGASGTLAPPIVETNDAEAMIMTRPSSGSSIVYREATNLGRSGASLGGATNVTVPAFSAGPLAGQSGTTDTLDVLQRFQDHGTQIGHHALNISTVGFGSFPVVRWWQIDGTADNLEATGDVWEDASSHDFNPAIAGSPINGTGTNPIGQMFFTWTSTIPGASGHNARIKVGGRLATDAATLIGGLNLAPGSSTFYNPSSDTNERWGDYASVTLDPKGTAACPAGNRAWMVNEKNNSTTLWGSRFGRLGFC